jgi:hypothetical protein
VWNLCSDTHKESGEKRLCYFEHGQKVETGREETHQIVLLGGDWELEFSCETAVSLDGFGGKHFDYWKSADCGMGGESGSFISGSVDRIVKNTRRVNCVLLHEMNSTVCQERHGDIGSMMVLENHTSLERLVEWGKCAESSVRMGGATTLFRQTAKLVPQTLAGWNNLTKTSFQAVIAEKVQLLGVDAHHVLIGEVVEAPNDGSLLVSFIVPGK